MYGASLPSQLYPTLYVWAPQGSCSLGLEVLWRICYMDIIDQIIGLLFSLKA